MIHNILFTHSSNCNFLQIFFESFRSNAFFYFQLVEVRTYRSKKIIRHGIADSPSIRRKHRAYRKHTPSNLDAEEVSEVAQRVRIDEILDSVNQSLHSVTDRLVDAEDVFAYRNGEIVQTNLATPLKKRLHVEAEITLRCNGGLEQFILNNPAEIAPAVPDAGFEAFQCAGEVILIIRCVPVIEQKHMFAFSKILQNTRPMKNSS